METPVLVGQNPTKLRRTQHPPDSSCSTLLNPAFFAPQQILAGLIPFLPAAFATFRRPFRKKGVRYLPKRNRGDEKYEPIPHHQTE
ncbi:MULTISPECIES: hypothetical protein [Cohnella]|uniref:hypothetical protein n=1 Tax=Cohnella TaxID=329857 RepID=UPI001593B4BC|nr:MULTISPECIES: hypothetical protein [Cohnella]MBN2980510.1 hypothetical protein [Cohnella algarum]